LSGVLFDVGFTLARRFLAGENVTQAHRGAICIRWRNEPGLPAVTVTVVHWGFAVLGGVLFGVLRVTAEWKLVVLGVTLVPQLAWLGSWLAYATA